MRVSMLILALALACLMSACGKANQPCARCISCDDELVCDYGDSKLQLACPVVNIGRQI
jgi:hypothetical protein